MHTILLTMALTTVPLLLAAIGGTICERSGVLNIGLEGFMLVGAFVAAWIGTKTSGSVGVVAAIAAGLVVGLLLAWVMVGLRADQVVTGIAFNILMLGLTGYLYDELTAKNPSALSPGVSTQAAPLLSQIPGLGVIFHLNWVAYLSYALVPITFWVLFKTRLGMRVRACGEYAVGAQAAGIDVVRVRLICTAIGSAMAAAGGAFLVAGDVGSFETNISNGQGYVALVIIILGRWHPVGALVAAIVFGLAEALTYYLQVHGVGIPVEVTLAVPYLISLLAIMLSHGRSGKGSARPPAEDGRPLHLVA